MDTPKNHSAGEGLYNALTSGGTDVPVSKEKFELEEILAEYGGSLEDQLLREAEESANASDRPAAPGKEAAETSGTSGEPTSKSGTPSDGKPEPGTGTPSDGKPEPGTGTPSDGKPEPGTGTPPDRKPESGTPSDRKRKPGTGKPSGGKGESLDETRRYVPKDLEEALARSSGPSKGPEAGAREEAPENAGESPAPEGKTKKSPRTGRKKRPEGPEPVKPEGAEPAKAEGPEIPHTGTAGSVLDDPVKAAEAAAAIDVEQLDLPESPRPISLEEVVNSTVEAVMEEGRQEPIKPRKRRWLFSRRKQEEEDDSERLPPPPEPEPEYDPEPIGPEPDLQDVSKASRMVFLKRKKPHLLQCVPALLPSVFLLAEQRGMEIPYWSGDPKFQTVLLLICLFATAALCRQVFVRAFDMVRQRRVVAELLVSFSVFAAAADCVLRLAETERTDAMPYAPVVCLGLVFAQWGVRRESRGTYDMFRCAALDAEPPYLVTDTPRGACKQRGSVPGFFTAAMRDDFSTKLQTALLPVFGMAALVFAGLSSFGQERNGDFFLNLSAILSAAATYSLPLCWSLPWSKLSERLQKMGAAVAGWSGAQKISRKRTMIVTDSDLFPPGTLQENGRKVYGEEPIKAIAYAASMAKAAGTGLEFLFRNLLRAENGRYEEVDEFSFYEEGGYSGIIHGETVLMGTLSFMRKMEIRLPADVHLKTGIFLAVDRHLIAIFAVKYNPAENVDFALKMMRRCHILPILASRDPNITPALLRLKFSRSIRLEFPDLSERVALSEAEKDRDLPRALLFREGLLPYAEAVAGSQRLCGAVRRSTVLSLMGSWLGALLAFYLLTLGAYSLLNPLALELFLLLWTLPVLLLSDGAGRY